MGLSWIRVGPNFNKYHYKTLRGQGGGEEDTEERDVNMGQRLEL